MLPTTLRRQLNRLRRRERLLGLIWSTARVLAGCAVLMFLACFTDWFLDLTRDTPFAVRLGFLIVQIAAWAVAFFFVLVALVRRFSDDKLALWVEEKHPRLRHRLISAVQFHRVGAQTAGMSSDLITASTRQAEEQAATINFPAVADHQRFRRAFIVVLPVFLLSGGLFVAFPETIQALLQRHLLGNQDIPRQVRLENVSAEVWPAGEEGMLRFRVAGTTKAIGEVRCDPESGVATRHSLIPDPEGEPGIYVARVPARDVQFSFIAWLGDGRLRSAGHVRYEPRPVVQSIEAVVQLPISLGLRPNGQRFEEVQKGGDIVHRLPQSRARVRVTIQKPVVEGRLELLGVPPPGLEVFEDPVRRMIPLKAGENPAIQEGVFDFHPDEFAYRVVVRDEYGFENVDRPRRMIRAGTLDPPDVLLLPELFAREGDTGPAEDREVEGIPVLLGQRFRFDYRASCRYGLSHAQLRYRVVARALKEGESGAIKEEEFRTLPLGPSPGAVNVSPRTKEEFTTKASANPDELGGLEGGGHYDFNVAGISDGKGGLVEMKEGDRIQFYVEVFSLADPEGKPGRSAVREKEIVALKDYLAWLQKKEDLKERTRELEERQRNQGREAPKE